MLDATGTIAFVYDARIRNNGTALLMFDAAKRSLGWGEKVRRYEPHGDIPKHDLYIYVDDGREDLPVWRCPSPSVYYAIDTHLGFDFRLEKARQFDFVFSAQVEGTSRMQEAGVNARWLPLACHPPAFPNQAELMAHPNREVWESSGGLTKLYDVAFVGYINEGAGPNSHNRLEYLDRLFREFPNFWISTNVFFEEMAIRYIRSRLGFNCSIRNDLNMRFFEGLSTGTALLTNIDVEGWKEMGFVDGEHFVGYLGMDDMVEKARWALQHPFEREQIAAAGHKLVREQHTYAHRVAAILESCGVSVHPDSVTV